MQWLMNYWFHFWGLFLKIKYITEAWNKLFCKRKSDAKSSMYSLVKVKHLKIPIFHRSTSYYPIYRSIWTFMLHENFQLVSYRKRNEIQSTFKSIDRLLKGTIHEKVLFYAPSISYFWNEEVWPFQPSYPNGRCA